MIRVFTALDWSFIVGVVMSFVAILFSFDAVSGERERGTLKLALSNSVPRATILLGKLSGIFIAIAVPLLIGMLLSLLIVMLSGGVALGGSDGTRIGIMVFISLVYISLFIGLGLAISSRMARSSTSLLVLLLIWVVLVVLVPNTLGCVVSTLRKAPSQLEFKEQEDAAMEPFHRNMGDLLKYGSPTQPEPDIRAIELWADYVTMRSETRTRLSDERLAAQFAQVQLARQLLRASSPTTIYSYVMESLAGTGFARHRQFVQAAQRYRNQFVDFIKATDRADPDSHHQYYLKEGLSEKPVNFESVPRFVESTSTGASVENALTNLGLLVLLSGVFLLAGYVAFLRTETSAR
jgi:ABC-type transport system involved in multi-copper enzyme maturation permease subunit